MKYKIVLVPFPFDDLSAHKVRPAICLTNSLKPYNHIILAFITSQVATSPARTEIILDASHPDFAVTGLKVSSAIRLHHLLTVTQRIIWRELGVLPAALHRDVEQKLRYLFSL